MWSRFAAVSMLDTTTASVADPHSFHPDPDPAFWAEYRSESNTFPDPIRIQGFNDQKRKKLLFFYQKLPFTLSLGLHKERPSYWRSLQLSKEAIQHFKTWNFLIFFYFCGSFLPSWIRIHWPYWIRIQSGSGSATLTTATIMVPYWKGHFHNNGCLLPRQPQPQPQTRYRIDRENFTRTDANMCGLLPRQPQLQN